MGKLDIYSGNVEIRELIDPRQNVPNAGKDIIGLINANCQVRIRESKRWKHLQLRSKGAPIQEQSKNSDLSGKQLCAGQFSASQSIHATHGSAGIGLINGEEVNIQLPGEVYLIPTQLRGPLPKDTVGLLLLRSHAQKKGIFVILAIIDWDFTGIIKAQVWTYLHLKINFRIIYIPTGFTPLCFSKQTG